MTDWGEPELVGVCDPLPPEFSVHRSGGAAGAPPVLGRLYVARVNDAYLGRYLCSDQADVAGQFRTLGGTPPTDVVFNYQNADGVSNASVFDALAFPAIATVDWAPEASADRPGPAWRLGPLDSFASAAELRPALGPVTGEPNERRLAIALLVATRHVLHLMGYAVDEDSPIPADPAALDLVVVDVRSSWRQATIAAAVRFYKSPEVPFGVAGGWDMATYVRMSIPDVDLLLLGQRERFGIA